MPNPRNPNNSAVVQMLLDMEKESNVMPPETAQALKQLTIYVQSRPAIAKKVDARFDAHRYPDKTISWNKASTFDKTAKIYKMSSDAITLLDFLRSLDITPGNLIAIKRDDIMRTLEFSKHRYLNAMRELKDNDCIRVAVKQKAQAPPVYMINPEIVVFGNANLTVLRKEYETLTPCTPPKDFTEAQMNETVGTTTIKINDNVRKCSTLFPMYKKNVPSVITDSTQETPASKQGASKSSLEHNISYSDDNMFEFDELIKNI